MFLCHGIELFKMSLLRETLFLGHEFCDALPVHQFQVLSIDFPLYRPLQSVTEVIAFL